MIRLLALSASGEVFFTRDADGRVWQHSAGQSLDPIVVNEGVVDRVVTDYGYTRIDEDVNDWGDVERLVEDRTAKVEMPDLPINPVLARSLLPVLDRWLSTPSDRPRVAALVHCLLEDNDVAADIPLRRGLLDRATRAQMQPVVNSGHYPDEAAANQRYASSVGEYFVSAAACFDADGRVL